MKSMYRLCILAVLTVLGVGRGWGQTNPTTQSIPYSQNFSSLIGSTPTYPAGFQGWTISGTLGTSFSTSAPNGDQAIAVVTNTSTSAHVGDFVGKLGLMSTGSALKAICLAINTTGYSNVQVSYDAATQRTENSRLNELGLQYRIGTSGSFSNIDNSSYVNQLSPTNTTGTISVKVENITVSLPVAAENQSIIQLRWVVRDVSGSGSRPGFSIDNISISGTPTINSPTLISQTVNSVGASSAIIGATISSDGGAAITARGTVWKTTTGVTASDNPLAEGGTATGAFSHTRSSLPTGTQIFFKGYATNSAGTGLSPEGSFYTLSNEPANHVTGFSASAVSTSQVNLSWNAVSADGYLILRRVGAAPTGLPIDATGYTVGANIGDAVVAALISAGATNFASITGLTPGTTYHFSIVPFGYNGSNSQTYNYKTDGSVPTSNATTQDNAITVSSLGVTYTEDFNSLVSSGTSSVLPIGWYFSESGSNANTTYTAGAGSGTTGDTYSFGATSDPERAFGTLQSGNLVSTIGAKIFNSSGSTITQLDIAYVGEQWRLGTAGRADKLQFEISTDATSLTTGTWTAAPSLDFSSPNTTTIGSLDGNDVSNRTTISTTLTGLSLSNNSSLWVRWIDFNADGADDGLAIDDFSITARSGGVQTGTYSNMTLVGHTTLAGNITVNNTLTFTSGNLTLGSNNLTIGQSATVSGAAAGKCVVTYGSGKVVRQIAGNASFQFPIGATSTSYNPLTIALQSGDPTETFSVNVSPLTNSSPGFATTDTSMAAWRVWDITEQTSGGNNARLTFQWDHNDDGSNIGPPTLLGAYRYNSGTGRYNLIDNLTGAGGNPIIVSSSPGFIITEFSSWIAGNSAALPVQLSSFTGTVTSGSRVRLDWQTISEVNNYGFYVQRRLAGVIPWGDVPNSFIPGHGTTSVPQQYTFTDNTPLISATEYRLKQVDLDGTENFSEPILMDNPTSVVETAPRQFALLQNYPNPFNPSTEIKFSVAETGSARLVVYNAVGQQLATLFDEVAEAGRYYKVTLNGQNFSSGMYFYRLTSGKQTHLKKLMLIK